MRGRLNKLFVFETPVFSHTKHDFVFFLPPPPRSRNSKLELELAQVRADFERLKSQDSTKSERLEELS